MKDFNLCDIVVVTADHPIGSKVQTRGEIGVIAEIVNIGTSRCYRVQNASRSRQEEFFYPPYELRRATDLEMKEELIRLMLVKGETYEERC